MAAVDTIRLLTHYHIGVEKDPAENRLTAALVALLTESQPLARTVARTWIARDMVPKCWDKQATPSLR